MFWGILMFAIGWVVLPRPEWSVRLQQFVAIWLADKFG